MFTDTDGKLNFESAETRNATVTNVTGPVTGGWQAIQTSGSEPAKVAEGGTLAIHGNLNGNLVSNEEGSVAGVELASGSNLQLNSSGNIGTISGASTSLTLNYAEVSVVSSDTSDAANIEVENLEGTSGKLSAADITANSINTSAGNTLTANKIDVTQMQVASSAVDADELNIGTSLHITDDAKVQAGTITAKDGANIDIVQNSSIKRDTLTLGSGSTVTVGSASGDDSVASSGTLEADVISMNGGTLIIDPEFGQKTATAAVQSFDSEVNTGDEDLVIDGNIIVGRNSALGAGMTEAELNAAIAPYQTNGSLSASKFGSILIFNKAGFTLADGNAIVVGSDEINALTEAAESGSNTVYFGSGGSVILTAQALSDENATLTFAGNSGSLTAAGGQLVVPAGATSEQISQAFKDDDGSISIVAAEEGEELVVTTQNGLYTGTLSDEDNLSDLTMNLADNARTILSGMSDAMYDYAIEVTQNVAAIREHAGAGANLTGLNFVQDATSTGNGSALERGPFGCLWWYGASGTAYHAGYYQCYRRACRHGHYEQSYLCPRR